MSRLLSDTLVIAERNLVRLPRAPDLLLAFTVQPVMFVLLFRYVFGGAITTLIDHASGLAVACAVEELTGIATIDLRVDYLRTAEPDVELYARSDCYRLTRNVAFIRAVAYERTADDPFASALGTFMLGSNRSDSSFERLVRAKESGGR